MGVFSIKIINKRIFLLSLVILFFSINISNSQIYSNEQGYSDNLLEDYKQPQFNIRDRYNKTSFFDITVFDLSNNLLASGSSDNQINLSSSLYNIELNLYKKNIQKIKFEKLNFKGKLDFWVEEIPINNIVIKGKKAISAYAIDPTNIDFESALVTSIAYGNELYKCKEYNFSQGICFGEYEKIMDLTPGKYYSFILTREDPLYTEITYQTNGCICTDNCTTGNPTSSQCTATCNSYCSINFTIPLYAQTGWLSQVHYNVTITLVGTAAPSVNAYHQGWLDRDLQKMTNDETRIGDSATKTSLTTIFQNNNMASSGSNAFDNLNCSNTWGSKYCVWNPFINTSYTCRGKNVLCVTTMAITFINYTWNYTKYIPNITIISPQNNSKESNNLITFYYNVTDPRDIKNCTLNINGAQVNITYNPQKNAILNFTRIIMQRSNLWEINCTNNDTDQSRFGSSGIYNLTLNSVPSITLFSAPNPINLIGGYTKLITCNGTAIDGDGYTDITNINATLFFSGKVGSSPDNTSNHYTNASCSLFGGSGNNTNFNCTFNLEYYSNNGTWYCNATVIDSLQITNSSLFTTYINSLLAIGIYPEIIDFGDLQILQISPNDMELNITNFGNVELDLSLYAYGLSENDNISMGCNKGNISFDYQRFSQTPYTAFNLMRPMNNTLNPVFINLNIPKREGGMAQDSKKPLYWKVQIPMYSDGRCNGKIVFTALPG